MGFYANIFGMKGWIPILVLCALLLAGCGGGAEQETYEQALARMEAGSYLDALALLESIPEYPSAPEQIAICRENLMRMEAQAAYDAAAALCRQGEWAAAREAFLALGDFSDAREKAAECDKAYQGQAFLQAKELIASLTAESDWPAGLNEAALLLTACPDMEDAALLLPLVRELRAGNYAAAGEIAASFPPGAEGLFSRAFWQERFETLLAGSLDDVQKALAVTRGWRKLSPERYADLPAAIVADSGAFRADMEQDELLSACGTAPAGRMLIYVSKRNYLGEDWGHIDLGLMRNVPEEYYPESLSQVEYLVEIHYDYWRVKILDNFYTDGIQEYASLRILRLPEKAGVGGAKRVQGPSAKSFETAVMRSEFVSGGPPAPEKVAKALTALLDGFIRHESGAVIYRSADGGAHLLWDRMNEETYHMPAAVDGLPVTGFSKELFAKRKGVRRVILPETLQYIPAEAFVGAAHIERVDAPARLFYIGENAFPAGTAVHAPEGSLLETYAAENGLAFLTG